MINDRTVAGGIPPRWKRWAKCVPTLLGLLTISLAGDGHGYAADIVSGLTPGTAGDRDSKFYAPETSTGQQVSRQVSDDGRYVIFASNATNLPTSTTGVGQQNYCHVYLKDMVAGTMIRLTSALVANGGFGGDYACISPDGQYVAYELYTGTPAAPQFTIYNQPVVVRNLGPNRMDPVDDTIVDVLQGAGQPSLSWGATRIAFTASDGSLINGGVKLGVFCKRYDQLNVVTRMSRRFDTNLANNAASNYLSFAPVISSNGAFVAFISGSNNIVTGDTNGGTINGEPYANFGDDIFRTPATGGAAIRVSAQSTGAQMPTASRWPSISADGRYVAFQGDASSNNLIFRKDLLNNSSVSPLATVTVNAAGANLFNIHTQPSISQNGRFVVFGSGFNFLTGGNLVARNIFRRDMNSNVTQLVSNVAGATAGSPLNSNCEAPQISGNGLLVAYKTGSSNSTTPAFTGVTQIVMTSQFFSTAAGPYGGGSSGGGPSSGGGGTQPPPPPPPTGG